MPKEIINKLDAATRQLDAAISLWFTGGDTISIHTLACSAYQIIHDINQQKGWRDLLYDTLVVKEEHHHELRRFLKGHYNFFKHSDKDSDETIEFDSSLTDIFILFSLVGLELFKIKHTDIRRAFIIWYLIHNPNRLTEKGKKLFGEQIQSDIISKIKNIVSRSEFFNSYILLSRQHSTPPFEDKTYS